jgi:hypothetical protein
MNRLKGFLLLAAVAALSTAGCSDRTETASSTQTIPIEPFIRVGAVTAGMTTEQVIAALGEPQRRTSNALEYTNLGLAVLPGPDRIVQLVMCGDVTGINGPLVTRFTGRTPQGIGMKSTRRELYKELGNPTSGESFPGGRESLKYADKGLTFALEGGKVHHITVSLSGTNPPPTSIEAPQ